MSKFLDDKLGPWLRPEARGRVTFWLFAIGAALRIYFSLYVHRPGDFVSSDMSVYDVRAGQFLDRAPDAWDTFTPLGYPALLSLIYRIFGKSYTAVGVVQGLLGGGTCALAYRLALRVSGSPRVALLTGAGLVVYVPYVFYGGLLLTEGPASFFVVLAALAVLRAAERPGVGRFALAGLSLGFLTLIRPNVVLAYPFLALYAWVISGRSWRGALGLAGPIFAWALPLLVAASVHNSRVLGKPTGLATNGGLNFFLAHTPWAGASYQAKDFTHRIVPIPNMLHGHDTYASPTPFYEEGPLYRAAFAYLAENPYEIVGSLDNVQEGLGAGRQTYWPGWPEHDRLLAIFSRGFFWLVILPVGLYSLVLGRLGRLLLPEESARLLLFGFIASAVIAMYAYLGDPRVRVPFDALLWLLAVDGWDRAEPLFAPAARRRRKKRRPHAPLPESVALLPEPAAAAPGDATGEDDL